jgi:hypothetical protein
MFVMIVSLDVKNFMNFLILKLVFSNPFVKLQWCYKVLQAKNVVQLTIEMLICAPIL